MLRIDAQLAFFTIFVKKDIFPFKIYFTKFFILKIVLVNPFFEIDFELHLVDILKLFVYNHLSKFLVAIYFEYVFIF